MEFIYLRKIIAYECDIYGHLNNANYLHIFEEARSDALEKMDMSIGKCLGLGLGFYLTSVEVNFKRGLKLDRVYTVKTGIASMDRLKSEWRQEIYDAENNLHTVGVFKVVFVLNGKPGRIKPETFSVFSQFL